MTNRSFKKKSEPKKDVIATIIKEMRDAAKSCDLFDGEEVGEPLVRGMKVKEWANRIEQTLD